MGPHSRQAKSASTDFEEGFELFRGLIAEHPGLASEYTESLEEFLGGRRPRETSVVESKLRDRRHLEWFLFERSCLTFSALPVEGLLASWLEVAREEMIELRSAYLESITGLVEILDIGLDGSAQAHDLAGFTRIRLAPPSSGVSLEVGDLIAGRLHPIEDGLHAISPAAGLFRSRVLKEALRQDLEDIRGEHSRAVLRLSQLELEKMFWRTDVSSRGAALASGEQEQGATDPVGELRSFFAQGGLDQEVIETWCRGLARFPFDSAALAPGVGDMVAQILEQLAIQSELDLDQARGLLLRAWPILSAMGAEEGSASDAQESDSQRVLESLAEFDRDRRAGIDVETSFRELARRLGLEDDESEEDATAPDFPGVVGAMVEEFLWESERRDGAVRSKAREGLRVFGGYTKNVGVFENLGSRELLSFVTFWLPESRRLKSAEEAQRMIEALQAFGAWSEQTHGLQLLGGGVGASLTTLERNLPRAVLANALITQEPETTGELFEFVAAAGEDRATVRDAAGEPREVDLERRLLVLLEEGDLLRAHTRDEDGEFVVSCCYPPEATGLRQSLR